MRVLITWGSKRGGTEGIARWLADDLEQAGMEVDLLPADEALGATGFDAAVVGGALYANRWHRDARRFVTRREHVLRHVPVWFFSSGPLDDSAEQGDIPPTKQVQALMRKVGAQGHATFGGRLTPDAHGFIASAMAKTHAGDWRRPEHVRAFAAEIRRTLPEARPLGAQRLQEALFGWVLLGVLDLFVAAGALFGGGALVLRPDGSLIQAPLDVLSRSPFADFLVPGLLLFFLLGCGHLLGGVQALRRRSSGATVSAVAGTGLVIWTLVWAVMMHAFLASQALYLMLGVAIVALAIFLRGQLESERPAPPLVPRTT